MENRELSVRVVGVTLGLLLANTAFAFDMGNMMNPSKWMGGDKDKDRYYDGPGYGYYGPGPGYGGYYGGYPGYGYPGYGYPGYGGYGYGGGYPGYGASPTIVVPGNNRSSNDAEIQQLRQRIRELESEVK